MIIRVQGASAEDVQAARDALCALAGGWGHEIAEQAETVAADPAGREDRKGIDPVAAASLVLSVPSAALAVLDLADRIGKRLRARELIGQAQQLDARQVTTSVVTGSRSVELSALRPDQLLDLLAEEDRASVAGQPTGRTAQS